METFCKLFGSLLAFVYHCFDRIVIQGYLPLLTRDRSTSSISSATCMASTRSPKQALANSARRSTSSGSRRSHATTAFRSSGPIRT